MFRAGSRETKALHDTIRRMEAKNLEEQCADAGTDRDCCRGCGYCSGSCLSRGGFNKLNSGFSKMLRITSKIQHRCRPSRRSHHFRLVCTGFKELNLAAPPTVTILTERYDISLRGNLPVVVWEAG